MATWSPRVTQFEALVEALGVKAVHGGSKYVYYGFPLASTTAEGHYIRSAAKTLNMVVRTRHVYELVGYVLRGYKTPPVEDVKTWPGFGNAMFWGHVKDLEATARELVGHLKRWVSIDKLCPQRWAIVQQIKAAKGIIDGELLADYGVALMAAEEDAGLTAPSRHGEILIHMGEKAMAARQKGYAWKLDDKEAELVFDHLY